MEWHRFSATTKERCITMQSTITAALVQKARKQGREEKIAIEQMEDEEESNSENDIYVPETTSKESQLRGEAPTCNGEVCKVNKALGISGRRRRWNNNQYKYDNLCSTCDTKRRTITKATTIESAIINSAKLRQWIINNLDNKTSNKPLLAATVFSALKHCTEMENNKALKQTRAVH